MAFTASAQTQQDYPARPIKLIAPFAAGSTLDITGRIVAQHLGEALGQPIVVENRSGVNGLLGSNAVAKAAPDGYTLLLMTPSTLYASPSLYTQMLFDPIKDLAPVTKIANTDFVLIAGNDLPVKSLADLIALVKSEPGKHNIGHKSLTAQLSVEWFKQRAGIEMQSIPYRDASTAFVDLNSGQLTAMFEPVPSAIGQIRAGRVRALAVSAEQRSETLPDVPTIIESGFPDFNTSVETCIYAPAGTPPQIMARLHSEMLKILQREDVRKQLAQSGLYVAPSTPERLAAAAHTESAKWQKVIQTAKMPRIN
jgi:tripartite-type tricarboxylate transporter receptor subunit TctC